MVSSEFTCFGHKWRLKLYPGGNTTLVEDGMVSIALHNQSDRSITVQYGYSIKHKGRKVKCDFLSKDEGSEFAARGTRDANNQIFDGWVRPNFWKRSQIIDNLVDHLQAQPRIWKHNSTQRRHISRQQRRGPRQWAWNMVANHQSVRIVVTGRTVISVPR